MSPSPNYYNEINACWPPVHTHTYTPFIFIHLYCIFINTSCIYNPIFIQSYIQTLHQHTQRTTMEILGLFLALSCVLSLTHLQVRLCIYYLFIDSRFKKFNCRIHVQSTCNHFDSKPYHPNVNNVCVCHRSNVFTVAKRAPTSRPVYV